MALSAPGIGSGLDVNSIVSQLVALERRPITQLETQKSSLQTKLSQWGKIKASLSALQDAANRLREGNLWNNKSVSVTGAGLSASATTSAATGSFSVNVDRLASAQRLTSDSSYASGPLGWNGSLQITTGQWSGTTFTPGGAPATGIPVSVSSSDSLADIAQKINSADAGVAATVVDTGSGLRLAIRSNATGEVNGFAVRAFDAGDVEITDGSGLGSLSFASGITNGLSGTLAQDALLDIDGIPVTSASNTVSTALAGVTLSLSGVTSSSVQVVIAADKTQIKEATTAFQKAYNDLNTLLRDSTKADGTGQGSNGPLVGDQAAVGIQRGLRTLIGNTGPGGLPWSRLSDVGLRLQRDGSLSIDSRAFEVALEDPSALRSFFDDIQDGFATRVSDLSSRVLAFDGTLQSRTEGLQESIARRNDQIARQEQRIDRIESQLRAQYARLDATLSGLNGLSSYISQQITQWNQQG